MLAASHVESSKGACFFRSGSHGAGEFVVGSTPCPPELPWLHMICVLADICVHVLPKEALASHRPSKAFWNIVNWNKVSRNYEAYAKQGKPVPPTPTGGGHAVEL